MNVATVLNVECNSMNQMMTIFLELGNRSQFRQHFANNFYAYFLLHHKKTVTETVIPK